MYRDTERVAPVNAFVPSPAWTPLLPPSDPAVPQPVATTSFIPLTSVPTPPSRLLGRPPAVLALGVLGAVCIGAGAVLLPGLLAEPVPEPVPTVTVRVTVPVKAASVVTTTVAPPVPGVSAVPAGPPAAQAPGVPDVLPVGAWVTVLESLDKGQVTLADARATADQIAVNGRVPWVADSSVTPGMNPGYWALVDPAPYDSQATAAAVCALYGRQGGGTCYPRRIVVA